MPSFLHVADLHLGMRATRFDAKTAEKVREARFAALDELLAEARRRQVDFLVIAGDLFDDHAVDSDIARRAFLILENSPAPVYILPGNHDPLLQGAVWDRPPWNNPQPNRVRLLRDERPVEVQASRVNGQQLVLLPCPVRRKTCLTDPTAWISGHPPVEATIRIGLAHGSLKVRDDLPADDHLIARSAAADHRLDYLALGHWHRRQLFCDADGVERTAYSGVHEPMRFQGSEDVRTGWMPYSSGGDRAEFHDAGKGEALYVRIDRQGMSPQIEPVATGQLTWEQETRDLTGEEDLSRLINDVVARPNLGRRMLRLKLTGVVDAATRLRIEELRQILAGRYLLGELDDTQLHLRPTDEEIREVAGQGVLRRVLEQLQTAAAVSSGAEQRLAERATLLLYQIAKEAGG